MMSAMMQTDVGMMVVLQFYLFGCEFDETMFVTIRIVYCYESFHCYERCREFSRHVGRGVGRDVGRGVGRVQNLYVW
jgi:hypothetical protein